MNDPGKCPFCPGSVASDERYPRLVCDECADRLTDEMNRKLRVEFNWSGGHSLVYEDTGDRREGNIIFIDGRRCVIEEDRFGRGIVVQLTED